MAMDCTPPPPLEIRYPLDAWPPPLATALLALQWLVILLPGLLVLGDVVAQAQGLDPGQRVAFLQRLLVMGALVQAAQIWWGHRLPGLVGPATVLLVGMIATLGSGLAAVNGALVVGGGFTALLGLTGLAGRLGRLYTPPVLAATLLLIAVSLSPTMLSLVLPSQGPGAAYAGVFIFCMVLVGLMLWAQFRLKGLASSSVLLLGMFVGSAAFHLLGLEAAHPASLAAPLGTWSLPDLRPQGLSLEPGVIAAFCLCYLALTANELATVESLGPMVGLGGLGQRPSRAVLVSGLGGMLAGLWGLPGPVTYSVSPGVLLASKSASRLTLLPAAGLLLLLALWPQGLSLVAMVPPPVVGAVLFSLMANTVYASVAILARDGQRPDWASGLVVGCGLTGGIVVTFMPPEARQALHPLLRPLLANGFVMGLLLAILAEHLVLRRPSPAPPESRR